MSLDHWLLLIHIAAAGIWLGGTTVLYLLSRHAIRNGSEMSAIRQFEWVGPRSGGPLSLLILGTGIWMILRSEIWDFTRPWILWGLLAFVVLTFFGIGLHRPNFLRIDAAEEEGDTARAEQLAHRGFAIAGWEAVVLLATFGVMVFKP